jgi:hypothetical protein
MSSRRCSFARVNMTGGMSEPVLYYVRPSVDGHFQRYRVVLGDYVVGGQAAESTLRIGGNVLLSSTGHGFAANHTILQSAVDEGSQATSRKALNHRWLLKQRAPGSAWQLQAGF